MELLQSLEAYTISQKSVGIQFAILGILLMIIAGGAWFYLEKNAMSTGLKYGTLVAGVFIFVAGIVFRNYSINLHKEKVALFQSDKVEFQKTEKARIGKVVPENKIVIRTCAALVVVGILLIVFLGKPMLSGVCFALVFLFTGIMAIESLSRYSILAYFEAL